MPTFHDTVYGISQKLAPEYKDNTVLAHQAAGWVLQAITGKNEAQLIAQDEINLSDAQQQKLDTWIKKITIDHEPLAYLIGYVPFNGLEILVKPPILIPRPETEEWTINLIAQLKKLQNQELNILDIGTGSGCVALALAHVLPQSQILGVDISHDAIELARTNAQHNHISNATFFVSNLFDAIPDDLQFDLIVANPPYIAPEEWNTLAPSIKEWEDKGALIAPDHGLALIKKIIKQAPAYLKSNRELTKLNIPNVMIEIGYTQGNAVKELFNQHGYQDSAIVQDLENKDRIAQGRFTPK